MATEEQTQQNSSDSIGQASGYYRAAQRLTVVARLISKLSFKICKYGTPTGNVTFTIRKVSNDSLLASKVWGLASALSATYPTLAWEEVTFDSPVSVNEEVRVCCEYTGSTGNQIFFGYQNTDVKANEKYTKYTDNWVYESVIDAAYIYTYTGGTTSAPSVTTQAVTAIAATTATGNGNVISLGSPAATLYGHCWATHSNPTTADSKTEGVPAATGAYTSAMTGLLANTLYYVRAYITNTVGTFYGNEVTFTTSAGVPAVTTNLCTSLATTTALGNGSIDNTGGSAVTQHGHCWSVSANPTTADSKTTKGAGVIGTFTSNITGLTAATLYHTRAYATNSTGTGYGADKTFTTQAVGAPTVTTQALTSIKPPTVTGNGTIVDIGGSAVTEHGHCWAISTNPTTADYKTTNGAGSVGTFTSAITGLTVGTIYYIRAYATNSYGTSYGDNVQIYGAMTPGNYAVKRTWWAYIGYDGIEYYLQGESVT